MPDETPEVNTSWRNGSAGEGRYWVCLQQQVPKEDIMTDQMVLQTQQWLNKTYGMIPDSRKSTRTAELVGRQSMRLLAHCRLNWASSPLPITSVLPPSGYSRSGIRMRQQAAADKSTSNVYSIIQGRCGARATPLVATSHSISTTEQVPRSGSLKPIWA